MSTNPSDQPDTKPLVKALVEAIESNRFDEARTLLDELYEINPAAREVLVFPTIIAIGSGQALDALRHLNSLPEGRCDELKALCLYALGDPTWHRYAEEKADDPDPLVREAMLRLLGRSSAQPGSTASP